MARFWFDQAHRLHQAGTSRCPRIDTAPPAPVTSSLVTATAALGAGMPGRDNEGADPAVGTGQFLRWAINHLTTADAVLRLDVYTDDSHHAGGG
ncbi:hypothetical protein BB341_30525 (plasmid) [Streptomyces clavuligerus]|nr:hypothetical protein BB341_30525 [Streptomyces clavuligerus]EDY52626.1 conserved hypothetical protein [Streptomyces clavuligerus]